MFSADRHTVAVARGSRVEALVFLLVAVVLLAASSYALSRSLIGRPLADLIRTVRMIDSEQSLRAMARPPTLELAELADEFNQMIWRLQTDSSKRLAELDRERSKTATIIESIEDGLIVLDPQRAIVHMNEVASAILDVPQAGILGTRLESLVAARLSRGAPGGRAGPSRQRQRRAHRIQGVPARTRSQLPGARFALDRDHWHQQPRRT